MPVYAVDVFENREDNLLRKVLTKYFAAESEAYKYYDWYTNYYAPLQTSFTYASEPYIV